MKTKIYYALAELETEKYLGVSISELGRLYKMEYFTNYEDAEIHFIEILKPQYYEDYNSSYTIIKVLMNSEEINSSYVKYEEFNENIKLISSQWYYKKELMIYNINQIINKIKNYFIPSGN